MTNEPNTDDKLAHDLAKSQDDKGFREWFENLSGERLAELETEYIEHSSQYEQILDDDMADYVQDHLEAFEEWLEEWYNSLDEFGEE